MWDDPWAHWLNFRRHGGDAQGKSRIEVQTAQYADKLLDALALRPGSTLLDIGSGEGLIGFTALAREPQLRVTFTDISLLLLDGCRTRARAAGVSDQCHFLRCSAAGLAASEASQDLVTARSVLAYEANKVAAFEEMYRVLRPGGRFSIAEPLFREEALAAAGARDRVTRRGEPLLALLHRWKAAQFPDTQEAIASCPFTNYDERTLLRMAQGAGFTSLHLELHVDIQPSPPRNWEGFLQTSPHPLAPSLGDIIEERFSPAEAAMLERTLRPAVEAGGTPQTKRMIYLSGEKPASNC
ncbi:class I SAM-dependent methyltransferase [Acidocella sp.]|uniref:class I SAM-dependent methyltransferase n=1 Tax=Acidocella sp. TaxID=50710 RepID=UPI0026222A6C|nr:class I SAM-dependent methyltransferase [Acidocella sp.]